MKGALNYEPASHSNPRGHYQHTRRVVILGEGSNRGQVTHVPGLVSIRVHHWGKIKSLGLIGHHYERAWGRVEMRCTGVHSPHGQHCKCEGVDTGGLSVGRQLETRLELGHQGHIVTADY